MKDIIIELPKMTNFITEVHNELTEFLDQYNIILSKLPKDDIYRDLHKTYIYIDHTDIFDLLSIRNNQMQTLAFRIIGATRGGIYIRELNRTGISDGKETITRIEYEIIKIEFIPSTCFECLKAYSKDVINASNNKLIGTKIIIDIHQ